MNDTKPRSNFIRFLGTAGARFVMIRQLRASGGLWISCNGTQILVDPGPGSIVRCNASRPRLDPGQLDGIILTHKHLDHANDINVMIEAMTEGGFKKRGVVICPRDVLEDSVILAYARLLPGKIEILRERSRYRLGNFSFVSSMKLKHPAETYGFKFRAGSTKVALLPDTRYFKGLEAFFKADILILSVVFFDPRPGIDHLSLPEAEAIIGNIRPRKAILTHFGMTMLKAGPHRQARKMTKRLGIEVQAAYDGMQLLLDTSV